jgi:hypothetical protein
MHMNKLQVTHRQRAVKSALGSVRLEGLTPSAAAKKRLNDYAAGKITASELRAQTLRSVKAKPATKK